MRIKEITIGQKLEEQCFVLKSIRPQNGFYQLVLADKTSEVDAMAREDLISTEIKSFLKGVVKVTAIAKPGNENLPLLQVKAIAKAEPKEYESSELFDGLSEEKIAEYKKIIRQLQVYVHHEGFKKLLSLTLTDEVLDRLATMPATLNYHGTYKGGALASAALISLMVKDAGVEYVEHFNGLHQRNIDWALLLTASLLNTYGVLNYITPEAPFRKTQIGVDRGYSSVLQSMLERMIIKHDLPITEEELSKLLNIITCSVSFKTGIKATTKEGILLRHSLALYAELDMLDLGISEFEPESEDETYFFNSKLRRYTTL